MEREIDGLALVLLKEAGRLPHYHRYWDCPGTLFRNLLRHACREGYS